MTNDVKLKILRREKERYRSEVHRDLRDICRIQECIKRTEVTIESLEKSIFLLEIEVKKEQEKEFQVRNQPATETGV